MPFYGGEMPKLKEGTHADIYVPEEAFTNPDEIMRFNIDEIVTILPAGSPLWAMMSCIALCCSCVLSCNFSSNCIPVEIE